MLRKMKYVTILILIAVIVYLTYINNFAVEYLKPTKVEKTSDIVVKQVALSLAKDADTIILDNNGFVWRCSNDIFNENNTEDITKVKNLQNIVEIDAGYSHYLGLKNDGTVWAWGDNGSGQLGNGNTISKNTPMFVEQVKDIKQVKCGVEYTIALDKNGFVWTWGFNRSGQLGYESANEINTIPQRVEGLSNIKSIECGAVFSMAVDNNECVWSWGCNNGELGTELSSFDGISRIGVFEKISMISCGIDHSVLVLSNGEVQGWGNNKNGQLGIKMSYQGRDRIISKPTKIKNINNVMTANANKDITVLIKNDGSLWYLKSE